MSAESEQSVLQETPKVPRKAAKAFSGLAPIEASDVLACESPTSMMLNLLRGDVNECIKGRNDKPARKMNIYNLDKHGCRKQKRLQWQHSRQ